MTELESLILLNTLPQLAGIKFKRLWDYFGSAKKILAAFKSKLKQVEGINDALAAKISDCRNKSLAKEMALIKRQQVQIVTFRDEAYPQNLKTIIDPPPVLYVKGKLSKEDSQAIAIVGSRRASFYGLSCAEKLAGNLAALGITVISGMARGIDTASHRGALKARGRTVAVLGSGLSNIYPPENKELAEEISHNGAVISEFPMETQPLTYNFPRRNRVISGLSLGVVVVEAAKNSGALITANFALDQGREVFAVPGKVDSANSRGVNELIKQGAKLTTDANDILEELDVRLKNNLKALIGEVDQNKDRPGQELSKEENSVFKVISASPAHIDEIISASRLDVAVVMSSLVQLEMRHIIKQLPGKFFAKTNA